jgi:hypothetical protein
LQVTHGLLDPRRRPHSTCAWTMTVRQSWVHDTWRHGGRQCPNDDGEPAREAQHPHRRSGRRRASASATTTLATSTRCRASGSMAPSILTARRSLYPKRRQRCGMGWMLAHARFVLTGAMAVGWLITVPPLRTSLLHKINNVRGSGSCYPSRA